MKPIIQFKTRIPALLIPLLFVCLGLAPKAQAMGPDTDGSIAGSNNGEGIGVLVSRSTGIWNTGTGFEALSQLTSGNQNTATGLRALNSDINGGFNTATGVLSLFSNTNGFFNSATGAYSLANNISGIHNTANGYAALYRNTDDDNTATGFAALYHNTTGDKNTANGVQALFSNTEGPENVAVGFQALFQNTTIGGNAGAFNTAVGTRALQNNTTGAFNTAIGGDVLNMNTTTHDNTAVGSGAMAISTGANNTALGRQAGISSGTGNNNVYIGGGVFGVAGENDHTYIRNINTTSVSGGGTDTVTINLSTGLLGHLSSSRRYKENIKPMENTSEALYQLKPVTYRYKKEIDSTQSTAFGLIAEEVADVNPDLVARNVEGQPESVHYEMVSAMLLNEFLKEHRKVEQLEAAIAQQQKSFQSKLAEQDKQIEALGSGLQKLSAQLELDRPAPRTVLNK